MLSQTIRDSAVTYGCGDIIVILGGNDVKEEKGEEQTSNLLAGRQTRREHLAFDSIGSKSYISVNTCTARGRKPLCYQLLGWKNLLTTPLLPLFS